MQLKHILIITAVLLVELRSNLVSSLAEKHSNLTEKSAVIKPIDTLQIVFGCLYVDYMLIYCYECCFVLISSCILQFKAANVAFHS